MGPWISGSRTALLPPLTPIGGKREGRFSRLARTMGRRLAATCNRSDPDFDPKGAPL